MKRKLQITALPLCFFALIFVGIPLIYIICLSFFTKAETWGFVAEFSLESYKKLLNPVYLEIFKESLQIAVLTTLISLGLGYPFAYMTSKLPKNKGKLVLLMVIIPFWTNSLIRLYGFMILLQANGVINNGLKALGVIDKPLKLLYTQEAVLLGMVYALIPFMILSLYNACSKIDWAQVESARDLGATRRKAFFTVTLHQTKHGILAGCILTFIPSIGLFFISDLLGGAKTILLGNLIKNELFISRDWPFAAALSVIMMITTLLLMSAFKKMSGNKKLKEVM